MGPSTPAHATENVGKINKSVECRSYGNTVDINCMYRREMFDGKMNPHNASLPLVSEEFYCSVLF